MFFFFLPLPLDLGSVHGTSALILTAWLNSPSLLLRVFDRLSEKILLKLWVWVAGGLILHEFSLLLLLVMKF